MTVAFDGADITPTAIGVNDVTDTTIDGVAPTVDVGEVAICIGAVGNEFTRLLVATSTPLGIATVAGTLVTVPAVPSTKRAIALLTPKSRRSKNTSGVKSQVRRKRGQLHSKRSSRFYQRST